MTFNKLFEEWLEENHKYYIKENTLLRYRCSYHNHIKSFFANVPIQRINRRLIQTFLFHLKENNSVRTNRKLSNSTINNVLALLKRFFNYLEDSDLISKNPVVRIKNLPINKQKINKVFTKAEQKKIEKYLERSQDLSFFIYIFDLYTGLRMGELLPITWKDMDLRRGYISINKNQSTIKNNNKWVDKIGTPKTKSSIRSIPIPSFLINHLKSIKNLHLSNHVFINKYGFPLNRRVITKNYTNMLKKLRIRYISFHALRHTFATRALENNIDIKTISEVLGHSDASMTLNIYSHSLLEHKRLQMRKIKPLV